MVRAANVDDVRRCVEFSRKHTVPVAIRGGGHSYAGYGVADGALQIDLGAINTSPSIAIAESPQWAAAPGSETSQGTLAASLYTPMGSCGSVGVAGLTLAGGDTSGRGLYGTACDNLIGAQLVTADGDVRELGPGRNEDLYWAIRGGGGTSASSLDWTFGCTPSCRYTRLRSTSAGETSPGHCTRLATSCGTPPTGARWIFRRPGVGRIGKLRISRSATAAGAYLEKWKAAFRPVEAQLSTSIPDPEGEVWAQRSWRSTARSSKI